MDMDRKLELGGKCPKCEQGRLLFVVYGNPTAVAADAAKKGEILFGGDCTTDDDPALGCNKCGAKFGGTREMQRYRKLKKLFGF